MYSPKIKKYQKKFDYSYAFGAYPVIDLLQNHSDKICKILFKQEGLESEGLKEIQNICKQKDIEIQINNRLIEKISVKENTYVIAVFRKYTNKIQKEQNHLLLVNPSNKGNLGTILRTMLGFNLKNLAIIKPSVDIFDPLVIRATMGAFFSVNFQYFESIEGYIKDFPNQNLYTFMLGGSKSVKEVDFKKPFTIVHGNESTGLDERYKNIGQSIYILHSKDIDSLNLSVATGISLWEATRNEKHIS
jgi:RNA methyltransferase, TrmH family